MTGKRFVVIDQDSLKQALAEADAGDNVTVVEGAFEKPPKLKVVHGKWVVEQGAFAQPGWDLCYPATLHEPDEPWAALAKAFALATAQARELGLTVLTVEQLQSAQRRAEAYLMLEEFRSLYHDAVAGNVVALRALPEAAEKLLAFARTKVLDGLLNSFNENKSGPYEPLSFEPVSTEPDFYIW
jgi:nucleotide-binding universal stress UspA family protein